MIWKPEDVRAFRDRDWDAFERAPVIFEAARSEVVAGALYEQVRAVVRGWPTRADRDEDLRAHLRLLDIFTKIHRAERCRSDAR